MLTAQLGLTEPKSLILNHIFNAQMINDNHLSNNPPDLRTPTLDVTMNKSVFNLKGLIYVIGKWDKFPKIRLQVKHDIRGTNSLLWTFRGGRNDGLLGVARGVKEDLTEIGAFVVVELQFQHTKKEKSTIITNNKKKTCLQS